MMKPLIFAIVGASLFLALLHFWAIPAVNKAQNHLTAHDRLKIAQMREALATE